jgi:hypothetical protein
MNHTAATIVGGISGTLLLPACLVSPVAVLTLAGIMIACLPSMHKTAHK